MSTCKRMWTEREIRSKASNEAKKLIEAGQTENAKPIYCHPIFFDFVGKEGTAFEGRRYHATCLILNNSETAFTLESFVNYVQNLCDTYDAKIMITGMCFYDNISIINTCIKNIVVGNAGIYGLKIGTNDEDYVAFEVIADSDSGTTTFSDGVNKIN